jgi:dipeptidyl aminopeptidase/acylaminoacyl peptidase
LDKRPVTIDDLARLRQAGDPRISPDGSRIVFAVKTVRADQNRYETHLWLVATAGAGGAPPGAPRQVTFSGKGNETSPRWSPDGTRIAFLSEREDGKRTQVHVLPIDGGEAECVTDLAPGGVDGLAWAPDGGRLAFRFRPADTEWSEEAVEERKKRKASSPPRLMTRLHYREEGSGFVPAARWRVHVLDLATRATMPVTPEDRDSGPPVWAPDGTRIAVVRNTAPDPDLLPNSEEIFVFPADASADAKAAPLHVNAPLGPKESLSWSPDGAYLAYVGHDDPDEIWGVRNQHPWVARADGGAEPARDLTPGWDVQAGNAVIGDVLGGGASGPFWSADSRTVLFLATDRGTADVYSASIEPGGNVSSASPGAAPKRLTEGVHVVSAFTVDAAGESAALLVGTPGDAGDVYVFSRGRAFFRRLTRLNDDVLDALDLPSPVFFEAPSPDGQRTVPCWAIRPPSFGDGSGGPLPTVLYIHGGPHLGYGHSLFHEYQALAAAGYVVLYPNPRGSKGYGEAWTAAIRGNWGPPAQEDCLACVDYAIQQGWTDPKRVGVAGGSYGGYLTGWMIGNAPGRWAVAVAERGVYNLHSMAGTCDFVWRDHDYFQANATNDPADYLRNSPITSAGRVTTPTLIVHSEGDLRCPIEQAEQYFAALKRAGKAEVAFLRYGAESNHNLSRGGPPDLRLDRQRRIHEWFERHLKAPQQP